MPEEPIDDVAVRRRDYLRALAAAGSLHLAGRGSSVPDDQVGRTVPLAEDRARRLADQALASAKL